VNVFEYLFESFLSKLGERNTLKINQKQMITLNILDQVTSRSTR